MTVIKSCVLNINKPLGWTSRDVLNKLQKIYGYHRFGHAGTLDPLASGVMLVLVSDETKKQSYYMKLEKDYKCRIFFGVCSPTLDLEGPFEFVSSPFIKDSSLRQKVEEFLEKHKGLHEQTVPFFSAAKVGGKELYKHARTGNVLIDLPVKKVELKKYSVLDFVLNVSSNFDLIKNELKNEKGLLPKDKEIAEKYYKRLDFFNKNFSYVDLQVSVGSGYYVRSLARDLGEYLETKAILGSLVRSRVGDFRLEDSKSIDSFEDKPDLIG